MPSPHASTSNTCPEAAHERRAGRRWLSVWLVMASWCWMFRPSRRAGAGLLAGAWPQTDPDDAVSIGLAALNSTGVAVVHRRAPRHHPGGHARRRRRVRRPRLGRRPDRRHRNPRREQPASHDVLDEANTSADLPDHTTGPAAPRRPQPRRPQPGSRLAQPPKGHGLDPGEDDDTIPQREQPTAQTLDREVPIARGLSCLSSWPVPAACGH